MNDSNQIHHPTSALTVVVQNVPYSRVGVAIEHDAKNLFDFEHEAFQPLTQFLTKLL
jgi:hypothetical protein